MTAKWFSKRSKKEINNRKLISESEKFLIEVASLSPVDAIKKLNSSSRGLTPKEAERRLDEYGLNELSKVKRIGFWADIYERFKSPLVIQLLLICLISTFLGEFKSAIIVFLMILLSVGLSYILDRKSFKAVESLGKRVQSRTYVIREGYEKEIKMAEVVPGDIVLLNAGSIVPADIRILAAKDFFVSESALTGESLPVEKNFFPSKEKNSVLELSNTVFWGTSVTSGSARGLVVNTGLRTIFGAISEKLTKKKEDTSFDKGIKSFTYLMIRFMTIMVCFVFLIVGLTKGNWIEALLFGLAVAVGLTPEMLPMIITVNLAKGALSMAEKKVIVKSLPSIQNLGAIDILCTDKTGTLTQDRVVLERYVDIIGNKSNDVLQYAYLNSYFQTGLRNLIDRAILEHIDLSVSQCKRVDELPFDFQRRRMSVVVEYEGNNVLICKGAVEEIYDCCSHYQIEDEVYPLIDLLKVDLFEEVERLNREGFRVLGIAYREFPIDKKVFSVQDEENLVLLGYIAFYDPPKESAADALLLLEKAGVRVKVLTGDNGLVTEKVCKDVGLEVKEFLSGQTISNLSEEDFSNCVERYNVFVKLSPSQKEDIVRELKKLGHIVGYMGDGINDAPALKSADVGISVDSGTDVTKESADIVLLEKSLLVLEEGILEGRKIFANIIKYIRMGASSNFGNMFSVVGASYLLPFLPMKPVQILANNLLYDFSQTGIPTDSVDKELIEKPLKWNIENIKRFMIFIGPISSIFDYLTFALMWFFFNCKDYLTWGANTEMGNYLSSLFQTGWFVESLLTQTLIVHIIRTKRIPFLQSSASLPMILTTLIVMIVGALLPYSPFATYFGFVPLPLSYWIWILSFLMGYGFLAHFVKSWFFNKFGGD